MLTSFETIKTESVIRKELLNKNTVRRRLSNSSGGKYHYH